MKAQMQESNAARPKIVSTEAWVEARKEFLKKEKEFTRLRDELSRQRLELPWEKVEKEYVFEGPHGKITLAEVFDGRSQLIVYHFMFGPEWQEGCPSCSLFADHVDGTLPHLSARDVTFTAISRAPMAKIAEFKKRMGWHFNWVSSYETEFNRDYHVYFTKDEMARGDAYYNYEHQGFPSEEAPGTSVFFRDEKEGIFHTYSTFARGGDILIGAYNFLDIAPKGRDEDALSFTMSWVRHHDRYENGRLADADRPYWPKTESEGAASAKHDCCAGEQK